MSRPLNRIRVSMMVLLPDGREVPALEWDFEGDWHLSRCEDIRYGEAGELFPEGVGRLVLTGRFTATSRTDA